LPVIFLPPAKRPVLRPVSGDMKQDPYFKYLAAIIALGVLVALLDPAPLPATTADAPVAAPGAR
jgi:hypothetical protein